MVATNRVMITGASRGLGFALACTFLKDGYGLRVTARTPGKLSGMEAGNTADFDFFPCDLNSFEQTVKLGDWMCKPENLPHVLILNAGRFTPEDTSDPTQAWDEMIRINFLHQQYLVNRLLPFWKERKGGRIFCIGSTAANTLRSDALGYSLSKQLLHAWANHQFAPLRKDGILLTTIIPGATYTDSWHGTQVPPEKLVDPDEIARALVELARSPSNSVVKSYEIRSAYPEIDL